MGRNFWVSLKRNTKGRGSVGNLKQEVGEEEERVDEVGVDTRICSASLVVIGRVGDDSPPNFFNFFHVMERKRGFVDCSRFWF